MPGPHRGRPGRIGAIGTPCGTSPDDHPGADTGPAPPLRPAGIATVGTPAGAPWMIRVAPCRDGSILPG